MSLLRDAADAIAAAVDAGCSFERVYPTYQPKATAGTAVVTPGAEGVWGVFDEGSCDPVVNFRVVMIAGTVDLDAALEWFEDRLTEMIATFADDPTLAGAVDGVAVASWSEPELVQINTGDATQIVVTLTPFSISGFAA